MTPGSLKNGIAEPREIGTSAPGLTLQSRGESDRPEGGRPRGIAGVPTHTVGRSRERRAYARARLALKLCVQRVAGQRCTQLLALHTHDISSTGVFFLSPQKIEPGTPIELEVLLVDRLLGRGTVRMHTLAHVVRTQEAKDAGWHGLAATFDDISFHRDELMPAS